ncbi:MAG: hypothetical protein AAGK00_02875 [Pseudomonadota bacterium]
MAGLATETSTNSTALSSTTARSTKTATLFDCNPLATRRTDCASAGIAAAVNHPKIINGTTADHILFIMTFTAADPPAYHPFGFAHYAMNFIANQEVEEITSIHA